MARFLRIFRLFDEFRYILESAMDWNQFLYDLQQDEYVHAGYYSGIGVVTFFWNTYVWIFDPYANVHAAI